MCGKTGVVGDSSGPPLGVDSCGATLDDRCVTVEAVVKDELGACTRRSKFSEERTALALLRD